MPRTKKKYNERLELGRNADGTRIRKWIRADSKAELEALRRDAYRKADTSSPSFITLGDYADRWFETYKSNRSLQTRQMYENALKKLDPVKPSVLSDVTVSDLQNIINVNWQHPRVCEIIKLTTKQIYNCAIRDSLYSGVNPADDLELPKKPKTATRFISDDEMGKILECEFKEQDRLYVDVLRNTGMRPSEALAIMWEDIDFKESIIHVSSSFEYEGSKTRIKGTKTDTLRDIPLNSSLRSALEPVRQDHGFVFRKEDGNPFTKSAYVKMSDRILSLITEKIGKNNLVMYSFRHTFATFLYYHGCRPGLISTKKAAQIMGHSEKVFLDRYTHIDDSKESVAEILEKIK